MAMRNAETLAKERLFGSSVHLSCCHLLQMSQKFERRLTKSRQFLSRTPKCKVEEHQEPGVGLTYIIKYQVFLTFVILPACFDQYMWDHYTSLRQIQIKIQVQPHPASRIGLLKALELVIICSSPLPLCVGRVNPHYIDFDLGIVTCFG